MQWQQKLLGNSLVLIKFIVSPQKMEILISLTISMNAIVYALPHTKY